MFKKNVLSGLIWLPLISNPNAFSIRVRDRTPTRACLQQCLKVVEHLQQCSEVIGTSLKMFGDNLNIFQNLGDMNTKISHIHLTQ